jgi:hypothetical protein
MKHSLSLPSAQATASAELSPLSALAAAFAHAGVAYVAVGVPAPKTASVATASGDGKRISVTYERWDDSALDAGDTDDRGYEDEEGVKFEDDDEFDGTAVEQAVRFLQHNGAIEPSSSHFDSRVWYNSYGERDFRTGEIENKGYHLNDGWTDEEKQQIFNAITGKSATASHEVVAWGGSNNLDDKFIAKINANQPFSARKGNVTGTPTFKGSGWATGEADEAIDTAKHAGAEYWLYSYATPIGVKIEGQWYRLPGKYSPTTTGHQGILWRLNAKPWSEFDPHGAPGSQTGGLGLF